MRRSPTRESLRELMKALARSAPKRGSWRVYFVGGGTAVLMGWRDSTIDVDLYAADDAIFNDVQAIKERLELNIEFARPEDFVPPLTGSANRHVFIETIGTVGFYHYDPYSQLLSKIVRGLARDVQDARNFLRSGMVDATKFRSLVEGIPDSAYAKYPSLSRRDLHEAVDRFLADPGD
jgi:hypothetical protein